MRLTAQIKLLPTSKQHALLLETLERANAACNRISQVAWQEQVFGQYSLHKKIYQQVRADFDLSAQMTVRAIGKVADSYKLDQKTERTFSIRAGFPYDSRGLTYYTEKQQVSIWTLEGRVRVPYLLGERQRRLLENQQGESDLVYHNGEFFLLATCNVEEPDPDDVDDVVGVDFGIAKLATDSDGESFSGEAVDRKRAWYEQRRAILQSVGTKSAKRRLKQLAGRQARFQRNTNHCLSKRLIEKAKGTQRAIALEDLSEIRQRATVRKSQRSRHSNWSFFDLRIKIEYKAKLAGVRVLLVDPAYTSQSCSECGHCEKANRRSQSEFVCKACGHCENADVNAARNIRARGKVNCPRVASGVALAA